MGVAVAAAGSLLGGMAAKSIMGGGNKAPAGGGIPGLTSSQGSGKDHSKGSVVQVDPTIPLQYFQQAAQANEANELKGLTYYGGAVDQAIQTIKTGTSVANSTLQPLSMASNQALNQQLRMMGMQPIQATATSSAHLGELASGLIGLSDAQKAQIQGLQSQMDSAQNIKDPQQRSQALSQINDAFGSVTGTSISNAQSYISNNQSTYDQAVQQAQYAKNQLSSISDQISAYTRTGNMSSAPDLSGQAQQYQALLDQAQKQIDTIGPQLQSNKSLLTDNQAIAGSLDAYKNTYNQQYNQGYDSAYTGDQVADVIKSTPGYQFQFDQGMDALKAQQASAGMLQSGNAMTAATKYGQDLGMNYYNQYMNQLNQVVGEGSGATAQISSNQGQATQGIAGLQQGLGQQGADTYSRIGQYTGNSLMQSGILFNQDALANMAAQNKSAGDTQAGQLSAAMFNAQQNSKAAASAQAGAGGLLGSR